MSSEWVMENGWLVKKQSPSEEMAKEDDSRLDKLEARVNEIIKQLQALTSIVSDLVTLKTEGTNEGEDSKHATTKNPVKTRHFSSLKQPMSKILEKLEKRGLLKPLDPPQKPITKYGNPVFYCAFHQVYGHETDRCARLKHEIQDLIDAGKIPDPDRA